MNAGRIVGGLLSSLDDFSSLDSLGAYVHGQLRQVFPGTHFSIVLYEIAGQDYIPSRSVYHSEDINDEVAGKLRDLFRTSKEFIREVTKRLNRGEVVYFPNTLEDKNLSHLAQIGVRSAVLCPVAIANITYGYIALWRSGDSEPLNLDDDALRFLRDLSTPLGIVVKGMHHMELGAQSPLIRNAIENSQDIVYARRKDGTVLYINGAVRHILGIDPGEVIGANIADSLPTRMVEIGDETFLLNPGDQSNFVEKNNQMFEKEGRVDSVMEVAHKDGSVRYIQVRAWAERDVSDEEIIIGIARDITDRYRLNQQLLISQKLESLSVMAGGIAHDFNNYLAALMGNISVLDALVGEIKDERVRKVRALLQRMEQTALRATSLSSELLTFSKGGQPIKKPSDLVKVVMEVLDTVVEEKIAYKLAGKPSLTVGIDRFLIKKALSDILLNSQDAFNEREIISRQLMIKIIPVEVGGTAFAELTIDDNAGGISSESMERVFDPYYSTKGKQGLGLTSAKSIIISHGGELRLENTSDGVRAHDGYIQER